MSLSTFWPSYFDGVDEVDGEAVSSAFVFLDSISWNFILFPSSWLIHAFREKKCVSPCPGSNRDQADTAGEVSSTSTSQQQQKRKHEQVTFSGGVTGVVVDSSTTPEDGPFEDSFKKIRPSFGISRSNVTAPAKPTSSAISIKFGAQKPKEPQPTLKKTSVANVFNADDEDDEEEMPPEAKMRMRNLGRETPTSTGPNSFGKTKSGFCDTRKVFDKNETVSAKGNGKELKKS